MKKEDWSWLLIVFGIIIVGLLGGFKNPNGGSIFSPNQGVGQDQSNIQQQIYTSQNQADQIQQQIQAEQDAKVASVYKGDISIYYVNKSSDPSQEYIELKVNGNLSGPVDISGWTLTSTSTGTRVQIPQGTYLYFTDETNSKQDVYIQNGDTIYINTGYPPNGYGFKVNKCSGYLSQFQSFNPGLNYNCPLPRNENLSSIPKTVNNDDCLNYIQNFPQCRIQTDPLPINWSYECTNFITTKITYPSCVDTHKSDNDFYQPEWRLFLSRTDHIWTRNHDNITLYDNNGKVVSVYSYY